MMRKVLILFVSLSATALLLPVAHAQNNVFSVDEGKDNFASPATDELESDQSSISSQDDSALKTYEPQDAKDEMSDEDASLQESPCGDTEEKNQSGEDISSDTVSAAELFSRAQANYTAHNFKEAAILFHQAADKGHVEAQYMYALMLYRGEGVASADPETAAHYYAMAAEKGFAKAQYNLAVLYYDGVGVARDDVQSYKWLYLASMQKEPRALKMLPVAERNLAADQKAKAVAQLDLPQSAASSN